MVISVTSNDKSEIFVIDGTKYEIPRPYPDRSLSVAYVKEWFDKVNPSISKEVSDFYYNHLWGHMTFRKGNPNPWGWNGGRRRW